MTYDYQFSPAASTEDHGRDSGQTWAWGVPREALTSRVLADIDRYSARETRAYALAKRCLDVTVTLLALAFVGPILGLACLALLAERNGSVFYQQPRIGRFARPFMMFKLRTMIPDRRGHAEITPLRDRRHTLKAAADPRVTLVGRVLRAASLDELPQVWNVLRGDMSLVGPRPEQPEMLRHYRPEHYVRHCVIPGLTGWWQINGRCQRGPGLTPDQDLRQKLIDDVQYLERRGFVFDLYVLLRTIPVVLAGHGAS